MPGPRDVSARVDRALFGDPVQVGGYDLQAEARLSGWAGGMDAPGGGNGGGGAWLKLEPTALHVRDHDGVETTVLVSDPQAAAMRGMAVPAIAAAGVGVVLMIVARLMRGR